MKLSQCNHNQLFLYEKQTVSLDYLLNRIKVGESLHTVKLVNQAKLDSMDGMGELPVDEVIVDVGPSEIRLTRRQDYAYEIYREKEGRVR